VCGWISDEDAARFEADYQAQKQAFEAEQRAATEAREQEKAARRVKQEAAKAAKAARAQAKGDRVHPKALVMVGSPRHGITEQISREVVAGLADKGVDASLFSLAGKRVGPCIECDQCIRTGNDCFQTSKPDDDMAEIDAVLDGTDFLVMATPIFFAGVPGSLKCVFDRFQPRWSRRYVHGDEARRKRPVFVLLTGTGYDPYGHDGALLTARSALAIAGFRTDEAAVFLMPGSESNDGRLPELDADIAADARKLGRRIAHLAYESHAGVWERELTAPDVDLHDWNTAR
jgi:multimeric flavodoxin WrbA